MRPCQDKHEHGGMGPRPPEDDDMHLGVRRSHMHALVRTRTQPLGPTRARTQQCHDAWRCSENKRALIYTRLNKMSSLFCDTLMAFVQSLFDCTNVGVRPTQAQGGKI